MKKILSYEYAAENWRNFVINRICDGICDVGYAALFIALLFIMTVLMHAF